MRNDLETMESLILIDHAGQTASATDTARELINEALEVGALIGAVRTPEDNEKAVQAQMALKSVRKQIESAYRATKDPLVKLGRACDQTFHSLVLEIDREDGRIGALAAEFALAERRRVEAERIVAQQQLEKLEREKHAAIAATTDPVQQAQVIEDFSRIAAAAPMPSAPARSAGQRVVEEWVIETTDLIQFARWVLMSGRWECMGIEVKKTAVKELLEGGMKEIPGLCCAKVPRAGVRLPKPQKMIDV